MHRRTVIGAALAAPALLGHAAQAQTRLRWAHVYETNEPYHTQAVWAAQQIQQRTNNRWAIEVFPASALGNEPTINQGLALGTVDMIYTGVAFAGATYRPIAITNAPYALRDFDHFMAYRRSDLLQDMMGGYNRQTGNQALALTYYGERHVTANRSIMKPEDMRGMKLRVPQAPLFLMFTRSVGANATPIAFAEVYLALQQGTVDGQENPIPVIVANNLNQVQRFLTLTGHVYSPAIMICNPAFMARLNAADRAAFMEAARAGAAANRARVTADEQTGVEELRRRGMTVVTNVDNAAFQQALQPGAAQIESGLDQAMLRRIREWRPAS
jgi:tripartite ATP-independent transporter DctP family solute receptor